LNPLKPQPHGEPGASAASQAGGSVAVSRAFTLIELLVTIGIVAIPAGLLLTAVARTKQTALKAACMSNLKQLQAAWQMYADDFRGFCVANSSHAVDGIYRGYPDTWAGENNAVVDPDDTRLAQGLLVRLRFVDATDLFRCPADRSRVGNRPRTRGYSMDNEFAEHTNAYTIPFYRLDEAANPAQSYGFADESEETIDDGHLLVWRPPSKRWSNLPADRHARGAVLSFADGHVEYWRWKTSKGAASLAARAPEGAHGADLEDLRRLQSALRKRP
jgi:prepilin-type N-terminal cleavage/methylation domain-containing protein/prepilin-type processing-associated H-X9-DG protein